MFIESARCRQRGLTLIELIMFVIIISVGLAGILAVMNSTVRSSADPLQRKQAMAMAEAVLEEILSRDASATLPETDYVACSHRSQYVGVSDYACFSGTPATAVIRGTDTLGSAPVAALAGFTATVVVSAVNVSAIALQRVVVTVNGSNQAIMLVGYRAAGF